MSKVDQNLISQADYARHRGCSREAVRRAIASGRITAFGPEKLLDAGLADSQWQANTRSRVGTAKPSADPTSAPAPVLDNGASYSDWRTRREAAEAQSAELALAELRGELVRAADVRLALSRRVAGLRESFLQLPARVVPLLAADPLPASMDRLLRAEIVTALAQLAEAK